jgi:hypothetical protein
MQFSYRLADLLSTLTVSESIPTKSGSDLRPSREISAGTKTFVKIFSNDFCIVFCTGTVIENIFFLQGVLRLVVSGSGQVRNFLE